MNGWLFYTIIHGTLVLLGITHPLFPLWLEMLEHVNFKAVYVILKLLQTFLPYKIMFYTHLQECNKSSFYQ